jgi:hypothetical protein
MHEKRARLGAAFDACTEDIAEDYVSNSVMTRSEAAAGQVGEAKLDAMPVVDPGLSTGGPADDLTSQRPNTRRFETKIAVKTSRNSSGSRAQPR